LRSWPVFPAVPRLIALETDAAHSCVVWGGSIRQYVLLGVYFFLPSVAVGDLFLSLDYMISPPAWKSRFQGRENAFF
jgi:hypothetical protein